MKPIGYHPGAREEAWEAATFYEAQRAMLGDEFLEAVFDCEARIRQNPTTGFPSDMATRTVRAGRFPYGVVFREYLDRIEIVAVAHFSRRENYWIDRIEDEDQQ